MAKEKKPSLNESISGAIKGTFDLDKFKQSKNLSSTSVKMKEQKWIPLSLLPFIAKEFQLSFTQVGFLGSSLGTIAAIFAIPAGYLALRIGGFKVIFFALLETLS